MCEELSQEEYRNRAPEDKEGPMYVDGEETRLRETGRQTEIKEASRNGELSSAS